MRNNNGRISGKAIALFLVVLSLVNIGILIVLRQNGTTTSKQERETTDAMELYEGESVATPEPTQEEEAPATSEGVTAEAPEIQEDLDGESPSENPEASAEPAESAEAAATPKPAVKTEQSKGGPSLIYQEDKVPTVTQDDLDRLAQVYVDSGALQALDANGNDISEDIKGVYSADPNQMLRFYATFIVEDANSERAKVDTSFNLKPTGPVIVLTKYSEKLAVGSKFDPDSYVLHATDENLNNLMGSVTYKGKVNTEKPGRYVVQYQVTSNRYSASALLNKHRMEN